MRDSIGGIFSLAMVFAFIIIISGFIAFTTNYNKAFKMKNRIINILEKYGNDPTNNKALEEITEYAKVIGYSASSNYTKTCNGSTYTLDSNNTGWCYNVKTLSSQKTNGGIKEYIATYVDVKTFVSIDIPILNALFPNLRMFSVTGSTKQITKLEG